MFGTAHTGGGDTELQVTYVYTYGCKNTFQITFTPGSDEAPGQVTSNECSYSTSWATSRVDGSAYRCIHDKCTKMDVGLPVRTYPLPPPPSRRCGNSPLLSVCVPAVRGRPSRSAKSRAAPFRGARRLSIPCAKTRGTATTLAPASTAPAATTLRWAPPDASAQTTSSSAVDGDGCRLN